MQGAVKGLAGSRAYLVFSRRLLAGALSSLMVGASGFCCLSPAARAQQSEKDAAKPTAQAIRALTGARTRLVWVQDVDDKDDPYAQGTRLRLMGLDTDDGKGERVIVAEPSNYLKPLLTPRGDRIVYGNRYQNKVFVVNWDGSGKRELTVGGVAEVWLDPKTGVEWAYVQNKAADKKAPIQRVRLDNPAIREPVWDKTPVDASEHGNFQLSADGTRAAGLFPWPSGGVANLTTGEWQQTSGGCWTSMSPDDSYRMWVFDGPHRNIYLHHNGKQQKVVLSDAPGVDGQEVYHPRWSNHPRVMAMSGPGKGSHHGGKQVEIHLGRFAGDFTRIESWTRATHNERGDYFPDVWVQPPAAKPASAAQTVAAGTAAKPAPAAAKPDKIAARSQPAKPENKGGKESKNKPQDQAAKSGAWPFDGAGLVFACDATTGRSEVLSGDNKRRGCELQARGRARPGRFRVMDVAGGAFTVSGADDAILAACKKTNRLSIEAVFASASRDQKGPVRIVTFSSNASSRNFTLGQEGGKLVLRLRTPSTGANATNPQVELCVLPDERPHHVVVTYEPGRLLCYLDGRQVLSTGAVQGNFSNWEAHHLLLGDEWDGGRDWAGTIETAAIFNRVLGLEEARRRSEAALARLKSRKPAARWTVQARLLKTMPAPDPKAIAPYRRALVEYQYEIEKVSEGAWRGGKKILVAHWAVLDGKNVPIERKTGQSYPLKLERFDDNPQLESERRATDDSAFDLDVFYAVE